MEEFVLFSADLLLMELTHKVLLNFLFTSELIYFIFAHVIFDIISLKENKYTCIISNCINDLPRLMLY